MNVNRSFFYRHRIKLLCGVLLLLLVFPQYRLWQERVKAADYDQQWVAWQQKNQSVLERNRLIELNIKSLKEDLEATEERARYDLNMTKTDEILYSPRRQ